MNFDIVFVTYNSEKWIKKCINSILNSNYNLKKIGLYFYDGCSKDKTVSLLESSRKEHINKFNDFVIIKGKKNIGFGRGNNEAFSHTKAPYVFFLNIDCEIFLDTLSKINEAIENTKKEERVGIWELRQLPYEHPKYYDPYTNYTSWVSGACFVISRELFKKVNGFDKNIFLYCEDLELSWHVRKLGYKLKYMYDIPVVHHSYEESKFKLNQYIYSISNNIYIRYKYGSIRKILGGYKLFLAVLGSLNNNSDLECYSLRDVRKRLIKENIKMSFLGIGAFISRVQYLFKKSYGFKPKFIDFDYETPKKGAFYQIKEIKKKLPLVSIIVRTCGRPDYLRETLISIRKQTYKNIEVVVVEDGEAISDKMINEEFSDMNIKYFATGEKVGRCKVGNLGLKKASGDYLNFLDDDDLFYPDHVEVLVSEMLSANNKVVYNSAFETPVDVLSKEPYRYVVKDVITRYSIDFNYLCLLYSNITPIQAVMFDKEVYKTCGGFDENMDALEDWDLWIRYALKYPFRYVDKTTSLYRVPADPKEIARRSQFLTEPLNEVREKYKDVKLDVKASDVLGFEMMLEQNRVIIKRSLIRRIARKVINMLKRKGE